MSRSAAVVSRILLSACVVVVLSGYKANLPDISRSTPPVAKECQSCQDMEGGGGGWGHSFQSPGAQFQCDPNTCHIAWLPGICSCCHYNCQQFLDEQDLTAVAQIARRTDLGRVSFELTRFGDHVRYDAKRQALQVLGCAGQIIAHFPVTHALAEVLD